MLPSPCQEIKEFPKWPSTSIINYDRKILSNVYNNPVILSNKSDQPFSNLLKEYDVVRPDLFSKIQSSTIFQSNLLPTPVITNEYEKVCTLIELTENKIRFLATQQALLNDILNVTMSNMKSYDSNATDTFIKSQNITSKLTESLPSTKAKFIGDFSTIFSKSNFFMGVLQNSPGYENTKI
jgi:hypothetical protein